MHKHMSFLNYLNYIYCIYIYLLGVERYTDVMVHTVPRSRFDTISVQRFFFLET